MLNLARLKIIIKMLEIYNKIIFHRWSRQQLKIKKNKDVLTRPTPPHQYREACTDGQRQL